VLLRATCERDDRLDDPVACGSSTRKIHGVTILVSLLEPVRRQSSHRLRFSRKTPEF
jgi:hypothetical protein